MEEALYLSEICKEVTIIHRSEKFRGDQSLIDDISSKKNIKCGSLRTMIRKPFGAMVSGFA